MKITNIILTIGILISLSACVNNAEKTKIEQGKIEDGVYTNETLGWTINIPENWEIISEEQKLENQKLGAETIEPLIDGEIDTSVLNSLIGFRKNDFNELQSSAESSLYDPSQSWTQNNAYIKKISYQAFASQGIRLDSTATTIQKIDNLDFEVYEFLIYNNAGEVIVNQILYSKLIDGWDLGINITFDNEADKEELINAVLNSKFTKK